jgi:iron complex outermembrane receptor protein
MKPTEEFTARTTVSVGNYDALNFGATVSSTITDGLEGRLTVSRKTRDGYADNLFPGSNKLDDDQLWMARGELSAKPNDDIEIRLLGHYLLRDAEGPAVVPSTDGFAASLGARSNTDPFVVSHNVDTFFDVENSGVTAIATWTIRDHLMLESISAYAENSISYHLDSDGTELDVVSFRNDEDHRQHSQELRLLGDARDSGFEWQSGLYYLSEETTDVGVVLIPVSNAIIPVSASIQVDAFAVFVQGTYPIGNQWGITAGLRYNTETKKMFRPAALTEQASWNDWTPHIALEYRVGEELFAYASITKGFKSGGYNALGTGEVVGPENVWSYEIGSKSELLDRRLRVNSAAFYARYKDQQVNTFLGTGLARIDNVAESTIKGVELEILAALTRELDVGVTLSYLDAEFDSFVAADPFLGAVDLAGSRMSNAPEYSFSLIADYTLPIGQQSEIIAHADYLWQDDVKYDVFDDPTTTQKAYGILNASISYARANQRWKLGVWVRNLTDKVYFTSHAKLNFSPAGVISWTGKPRTYGVEFSWAY